MATSLALGWPSPPPAMAASAVKVVSYHGYRLTVPRTWPVYDVARDPSVCVRFDRRAVYLGSPRSSQRCPAHAAGRTETILLEALRARPRDAPSVPSRDATRAVNPVEGSSGWFVDQAHNVLVAATWNGQPGVVTRALGLRSLRPLTRASSAREGSTVAERLTQPRAASASSTASTGSARPGAVYTGKGFDACSAPSYSQMSAWRSSPYRAIGIYLGGINRGCSQPNLSAGWVTRESAAGWHLIPIYVGRQAPLNRCHCSSISASSAASEGRFAASDAVSEARSLGMGRGNPLYVDMEAYSPGSRNTRPVLNFLAAWTSGLHSLGYLSGVYSSDASGIADLVSRYKTSYREPDEIWIANWNGQATTSDRNVPSGDWPRHQRLHQYWNDTETYRGVRINIDRDYLDAPTAAAGTASASRPRATSPPTISGTPTVGQKLVEAHGNWSGAPTSYSYQWEACDSAGNNCAAIAGATGQSYLLTASNLGHTIRVLEIASNAHGSGSGAASKPTAQVVSPPPSYWLFTAYGNVYPSRGTAWYGSPYASGFRGSSVTGVAATLDGRGYWVVDAAGQVFPFGDAATLPGVGHSYPVTGIVAAPGGGYWLFTAHGNVYPSRGTAWYGSPYASGFRGSSVTGVSTTPDGKGYRVVDSAGQVFAYGDAASLPPVGHSHPITGIVS